MKIKRAPQLKLKRMMKKDPSDDESPGGFMTGEGQLENLLDYESDEGDDDETEYNSARACLGDNTIRVTRQILV